MGPQECAWGETALQVIADAGFAPPTDGLVLQLVNGYVSPRGAAVPVAERAPDPAVIERSGRAEELPRMLALLTAPWAGTGRRRRRVRVRPRAAPRRRGGIPLFR